MNNDQTTPQQEPIQPILQSTPATEVQTPPNSVYPAVPPAPEMSANTTNYLVGSQMVAEKSKLPIGIYIIAGYNLLAFVIGFFGASQVNMINTVTLFLSLCLAIALVMRVNAARKILIVLSVIGIFLSVASIFFLASIQSKLVDKKQAYDAVVLKVNKNKLSTSQKASLDTLAEQIAEEEKVTGSIITRTYLRIGASIVGSIIMIGYLSRPKIVEIYTHPDA